MDEEGLDTTRAPPSPTEEELQPGEEVGEYQVTARIGRGAYGTVYSAVHRLIGKKVAIKVLSASCSLRADLVSRFLAEARAVNQIGHPNIIDIFAFGRHRDGRYFHVMELLEGGTLEAYLEGHRRLSLAEATPILEPIARAVDAAHQAGVVHRDLKPANVILHRDPQGLPVPKLLDFGVAKLIGDEMPLAHRTRTGEALGTPQYMSPEQCVGGLVDQRADLYAYGVVMYRCLTGGLPFKSRSVVELLHAHVSTPPRDPRLLAPQLGDRTAHHLITCLAKRPADRPPSAVAALNGLIAAAQVDLEHPPTAPAGERRDPERSRRRAVWWGAAVALALATWAVWTVITPPRTRSAPSAVAPPIEGAPPQKVGRSALAPRAPAETKTSLPSSPSPTSVPAKGVRPTRSLPKEEGADDVEEWR
jgi:serine/threonine protein kinase